MNSPHLMGALGDAHRAELRRQAERYRQAHPTAAQNREGWARGRRFRTAAWLMRVLNRTAGTQQIPACGPGKTDARVRSADT
jgi:hypothetical protein